MNAQTKVLAGLGTALVAAFAGAAGYGYTQGLDLAQAAQFGGYAVGGALGGYLGVNVLGGVVQSSASNWTSKNSGLFKKFLVAAYAAAVPAAAIGTALAFGPAAEKVADEPAPTPVEETVKDAPVQQGSLQGASFKVVMPA